MNSALRLAALARPLIGNVSQKQLSSVAPEKKFAPVSERIKRLQQQFQKNDGKPIHLKGGPMDAFLYNIIMGGCIFTTAWSLYLFYQMSFPKKAE